ncbi:MAG: DUF6062 family protein [Chthonomonadales bacterium]
MSTRGEVHTSAGRLGVQQCAEGSLKFLRRWARVFRGAHSVSVADSLSRQVMEALAGHGCAVCRLTATAMLRRLGFLFHESVNDPDFREEVRCAGGFCPRHSALVDLHADALGIAIIMEDVVRTQIEQLRRWAHELRKPRANKCACPLCRAEEADERLFASALIQALKSHEGAALYQRGDGLCGRHTRLAMEEADANVRKLIVQTEIRVLESLAHDLSEFVRRCDYRFAGEQNGEERDAGTRALQKTAGSLPGNEKRTLA